MNESVNIDIELLQRVALRDRQAFASFYDRYSRVLFSIVVKVLNDPKEAEDVLQEVFLQIWEKADSYSHTAGTPFSWTVTIARRKAIDRLRSLRRRFQFAEEIQNEMPDDLVSDEIVFEVEKAALIRGAVANLPLEQRQSIEMAFFGGMTQHEISDTLKTPLGTVKARIRRGMLKLRDCLREQL